MTIIEATKKAVVLFKEGKSPMIKNSTYILNDIYVTIDKYNCFVFNDGDPFNFSTEDMLSDDWYIVER
jgi:hypothetical protein